MNLAGVTLTGADQSIGPYRLVQIAAEFPFVEWGILVGSSVGYRFPATTWVSNLGLESCNRQTPLRLSLHLCGRPLRHILDHGALMLPDNFPDHLFQRVQLNFHGRRIGQAEVESLLAALLGAWPFQETIVQLDGQNDSVLDTVLRVGLAASGLYDRSHGAGVLPGEWPTANPDWEVGYAGGLSPENVVVELPKISKAAGSQPFWIDMETHLRNAANQFDGGKVRSVLRAARAYAQGDDVGS